MSDSGSRGTSYRALFAVREFRFLYPAIALSHLGNQLAAVAVSVLVFDHTGSKLLTAVAYASAWLPALLGGPLLGPLADRFRRRTVMVTCDLFRAVLIGTLVIPGMPIWLAIALLYLAHLATPPATASRSAMLPEILSGDIYILGSGLNIVTFQVSQILGFAAGGVAVTLVGAKTTLLINACTYLLSAILVRYGVKQRPAPQVSTVARRSYLRDLSAGVRYVFSDGWLRGCLLLVWLSSAFAYAPEAIAYPYARELGQATAAAGIMLAAPAVGHVVGTVLLTRIITPKLRDRLLVPHAVLACAVLMVAFFSPPFPVVLVMLCISGFGSSFASPLNAMFVRRVSDDYRGRANGVAIAGITAGQGLGFLLAGALGSVLGNLALTVGICGLAGTVASLAAGIAWRRSAALTTT